MELFKRRPLCLCCGLFLLFSLLCTHLYFYEKLIALFVLAAAIVVLFAVLLVFGLRRRTFLCVIIALIFVFLALLNNLLRIELPYRNAQQYVGEGYAVMEVLEAEHSSEHSASYVVDVTEIDGERADVRALLVLGIDAGGISVGDTLYADVDIMPMDATALGRTGESRTHREDVCLMAVLYGSEDAHISRFDTGAGFFEKLFSKNGIRVLVEELRETVSLRLDLCLGDEVGGLAGALLMGDRSGVPVETQRDFRRSGVAHLFAVSGLHVSILLGAVELLLRKLRTPKLWRCAVLTVCALGLICLTGFSMSAMRSVFMLLLVYAAFLFSEENDSPTSLFLAVSMIIAISPYAVYELGMWMSFLATLGVVTVIPLVQRAIPVYKTKSKALRVLTSALRAAAITAIGTVTANAFLLPISFAIFGEISAFAIPANIILSPLTAVFLVVSGLAVLLCNVPLVSTLISYVASAVSTAMTEITRAFSELEIATVSLRYPFAKWLVIAFTVALVVMLVIKIPKKRFFIVPPTALLLSFCISVICFNAINPRALTYSGNGHREVITVCDDADVAIIDMSDGYYSRFAAAYEDAAVYGATEVDSIVLTSVSATHVYGLDYFMRYNVVGRLYIPEPYSESSRESCIELVSIADAAGVEVVLYDSDDVIELYGGVSARVICSYNAEKRSVAAFVSDGETLCGYVDAFVYGSEGQRKAEPLIARSDTLIIGNNGIPDERYSYAVSSSAKVIYASRELAELGDVTAEQGNSYCHGEGAFEFRISME